MKGPEGKIEGPEMWTILAEASDANERRNVVITGKDVYGLTAETLSTAALRMAEDDYDESGVLAPVPAVGLDRLQKELIEHGASIEIFES